jgi:hypothetical protein
LKGAVAAGTSVFIVIITALIVSLSHFYYLFIHFAADSLLHVLSIIIFALFTLIGLFTLAEFVL